MVNKSAKALIFFAVALIAFLCSSVFATYTYNMLADDAMEEAYSNSDNITVDDAQSSDNDRSNNHYYPNTNSLSSDDNSPNDDNSSGRNIFNINIFNLFNSTDDDEMDLHTLVDKVQNKISQFFSDE